MLDYQRIVDDVRSSLFSNSRESVDFLRAAAADYLVACDEVNDRLRRCGSLLKQGHRSEAIRLCEIDPNLLDVVATLDFPERQQWIEVISQYGLAAPPPLMLDVAADLNEAYALEQPLAELLKRHRTLALARSPLKLRLDVLRQLAECDPHNPIWAEDLATFEQERHKQLQAEVTEATDVGDLAALAVLDEELHGNGWLEPPSATVVDMAAGALATLRQRHVRSELEGIAWRLNEAHAGFDVDTAHPLRDRWNQWAKAAHLIAGDPLYQQAQPALRWLAEQDELAARQSQNEKVVAALDKALDSRRPEVELTQLHKAARADGFALPPHVENRYRTRLAEFRRAEAQLRKKTLLGISVAGVVAAAIVAGLIAYNVYRGNVTEQAAEFSRLIDAHRLGEAQTFYAELEKSSPRIARSDDIQSLNSHLAELLQDDRDRHAKFAFAFDKARRSIPDKPDPDHRPDWDPLREAQQLAATTDERDVAARLADTFSRIERQIQETVDQKFVADLAAIDAQVAQLSADRADDAKAVQLQVDQLRWRLDDLKGRAEPVSLTLRPADKIKAVRDRLDLVAVGLQDRRKEEKAQEAITNAVGDPAGFDKALVQFIEAFPDSPRTPGFERVHPEAALWTGMAKWNTLVADWGRRDLTTLSPQNAAKFLEATKAVLADYGNFPEGDAVRRRVPYLEAIVRRVDAEQQRIEEPLKKLFGDPLVATLWMVELKGGQRYYLKGDPGPKAENWWGIKYLSGFDLAEQRGSVKGAEVTAVGPAPQASLARSVRETLDRINDTNWDGSLEKTIQLIQEDHRLDPILKLNLLEQTLDVACRGSQALASAFGEQLGRLKEASVDPAANWLNPKDTAANQDRARARQTLELLHDRDVVAAGKAAQEDLESLHKPFGQTFRWIGWLRKGPGGEWQCAGRELHGLSGEMFVVRHPTDATVARDRIGAIDNGIAKIEASDAAVLVEGRPVYMLVP